MRLQLPCLACLPPLALLLPLAPPSSSSQGGYLARPAPLPPAPRSAARPMSQGALLLLQQQAAAAPAAAGVAPRPLPPRALASEVASALGRCVSALEALLLAEAPGEAEGSARGGGRPVAAAGPHTVVAVPPAAAAGRRWCGRAAFRQRAGREGGAGGGERRPVQHVAS